MREIMRQKKLMRIKLQHDFTLEQRAAKPIV